MTNFATDPERRRAAAARGLETRRRWARLKRQLKRGELSPLFGLAHPDAQDRLVMEVAGFMFSSAAVREAADCNPLLARAGRAMGRVGVAPSLRVKDLSEARRRELADAVLQDPLCAWARHHPQFAAQLAQLEGAAA